VLDKAITTLGTDPENTTARAVVDNLVRKYSIVGMTGLKNEGALQELADTLVRRHEAADTRVKEEQDKLFNTTGYSKWVEKNPTGKFEDFIESVGKKHQVSKKHLLLSTYLQEQKDEHAEGTARLLELESETGLKSMVKKSEALYKELNKQSELAKEKAMAEKERRRNQFIATEEELLRTKNKLQEQYRQELVALQAEQVKLVIGISETGAELVTYASNNGVAYLTTPQAVQKWHALIAKKSGMEDRLAKVEARIIYLQTLYANLESEITKGNTALEAIQNNKEETGIANNDVDVTATSETATQAEVVTPEQKAEQTPTASDVESTAKNKFKDWYDRLDAIRNGNRDEKAAINAKKLAEEIFEDKQFLQSLPSDKKTINGIYSLMSGRGELIDALKSESKVIEDGVKKADIERRRQVDLTKGSLPNVPDYVKEEIARNVKTHPSLLQKVVKLAHENKTKAEIAKELNVEKEIINSLRTYLQIPSMDSKTEFQEWKNKVDKINAKYDAELKAVESLLSKAPAIQTEPTDSTNWAMVVEQAAKDYLFKLKLVPNIIQRKVVAYEQLLKDGTETFSFSFLKEEIKNNQISLLDAGQVLAALKEYTEAVLNLQDSTQVETEDNAAKLTMNEETIGKLEENFIEDSDGDDSGLIGPPGSLELVSTSLEETPSHEGAKVENVIKINTLALDYAEFFDPQTNSYKRFSLVDKLNENANPNMIKRGGVKVGQKILLSVDTKFVGTINHDTDMVNDEYGYRDKGISKSSKDYLTVDGKVTEEHIEEVPIKITDDQGNILGWLPRMGWVTAKYPGTAGDEEYANVQKNVTDSEGNVHDNIEKQKAELMSVRKAIVEEHNSGKQSVPTVVVAISAGTVIHNKVVNLNTETSKMTWDTASKLLPSTSLKLAIVSNGTVYSAEGKESTENISLGNSRRYKQYKNLPVVLLPAYNGEMVVAPLLSRPLFSETGSQSDFNTIVRAIELFIGSKSDSTETKAAFKSEIAAVLEATEIDINTEDGLRTFINQFFTYTHDHFNDSVIAKTKSPTGKTVMKFLFKIENALEGQTHGSIKIGTTYSGKHPMHASLVNGKLHPDFVAALKAGIGGRYKNVNFEKRDKIDGSRVTIKGINTPGKFISSMFRTNGVWVFKEHDNYNEYIKANTKTNVVGTNEIDGEYVYTVHPQVQLDVKKILGEPKVEIVSTSLPDPSGLKSEDSSALSLLDSLLNSKLKEPVISIVNSTGQVEDKHNIPVSVASVTERYNFTLPEHRNGKSVNEVLADLQRLGISYLTDGYNPFSKCM
jgi:orotate phosphoribosyltransferase-like protein